MSTRHKPRPFVGVDGEGGDIDGRHMYTMLRVGDEWVGEYSDEPTIKLEPPIVRWLRFLATRPKGPIYVAYFFDYDVSMICRSLPEDRLRRLLDGQWTQVGDFRVRYHPRKFFSVRYQGRETTVNDVGTFFQCKFLDALKQWQIGTPTQWKIIEAGKNARNSFGVLDKKTIEYNRMECELLAELMEKFRSTLAGIGYLPRYWRGPGQLAKAMLGAHGVPTTDKLPDPNIASVWDMAQRAYFGGRFETSAVGPIPGPVEQWDINSAYPYACTTLPCLLHGSWKPTKTLTSHGLYRIDYIHPPGLRWHTLPHRTKDGSVHYPRTGSGTYWGVEILAGVQMGLRPTIRYGLEYVQTCQHTPFAFLADLYTARKKIGKTTAGMAIKLAMNSAYGVTAQSVGKAEYANPVYAGLITATCRAQILDAMKESPDDVYMVATDGIFARAGSLSLVSNPVLGGWDRTSYDGGIHIVQPGVYFAGDSKPKTRGVPLRVVLDHRQELIGAWHGNRNDSYSLPVRQFIGLRLAYARNRLDTAGTWVETTKDISYGWSTKRQPDKLTIINGIARTTPYTSTIEDESVPYDRIIGALARDSKMEWEDTPEWAQPEFDDALGT